MADRDTAPVEAGERYSVEIEAVGGSHATASVVDEEDERRSDGSRGSNE